MATANQGWARDYSACVCTYPEHTHMCVPRLVKLKHTRTRVQEQTRGDLGCGVQALHKRRHRSVLGKAQARVCAHVAHAVARPGNPVFLRRTRGTHTCTPAGDSGGRGCSLHTPYFHPHPDSARAPTLVTGAACGCSPGDRRLLTPAAPTLYPLAGWTASGHCTPASRSTTNPSGDFLAPWGHNRGRSSRYKWAGA